MQRFCFVIEFQHQNLGLIQKSLHLSNDNDLHYPEGQIEVLSFHTNERIPTNYKTTFLNAILN